MPILRTTTWDVTLSGPSGVSGTLEVTANGVSNNPQVTADGGAALGPGSYQVPLNRPSMPADTYSSVTATWNVDPIPPSNTFGLSRTWWVQGYTEHTQYNTPAESTCTQTQGTGFIFNPSTCVFTQVSMSAQFISQANRNGTGTADTSNHGLLKADLGQCSGSYPAGASSSNSFFQISSVTGTCNQVLSGSSVATYPNPQTPGSPWSCGDNLLVVNSSNANVGVYSVLDYCFACQNVDPGYGYVAHVDHYNTSNACSLSSLPGNWAADTH